MCPDMRKLFAIVAVAVVSLAACLGASAQSSNLSIGSYKVKSVKPTSFTSVDGTVTINLANSGAKITITEISGIVYKGETPFMIGTADDIVIPAGESSLNVVGHCSLSSMSGVFALIANPTIDPAAYNADIYCKVRYKGKTREVDMKKVPLSTFLSK